MTGPRPGNPTTSSVLAQWDQWLGDATDRLMDLDDRSVGSTADVRADLAAAFVCRKAVAARVDAMRSAGDDARRLAEQPVVDDHGELVGPHLEGAAALLTAVLNRVEATVGADEAAAQQLAADSVSASTDLGVAERLAADLGEYVQRVSAVRAQIDAAGRSPARLHQAADASRALRGELEAMAAERDELFRRWDAVPGLIDAYRRREPEVRAVVERCREKVRPLPTLAVPSVDALDVPAPADDMRRLPWPVARATMRPMLDRLDRLDDAFDEVERRFSAVLSRRDELRGLLHAFRDKAGGSGLAEHPDLEPSFRQAERELWSAPCDVDRAASSVEDYTTAVNRMIASIASATIDPRAR